MKEVRYFFVPNASATTELPADECSHAVRVLRLGVGDEIMLMDGRGTFYRATVTEATNHHCRYTISEQQSQQPLWPGRVCIAVAPTKMMERIEWLTEKAVEIGTDEITLLDCRFSERRTVKTERLEKIMLAAVKQSRKAWLTKINGMTQFDDFVSRQTGGKVFIAHCYDEIPRTSLFDELCSLPSDTDVTVMVGPEGDFSIDEVRTAIAAGCRPVSLGDSRLRTETAALSAVMMMQLAKTSTHSTNNQN